MTFQAYIDNIEAKTGKTPDDSFSWAEQALRRHGMPKDEIRAVLTARDPRIVRRYLELHRERLQELLDDKLRTLGALETVLVLSGDDPHLLERGGHMPRRRQTLGQGGHVTHAELQDGSALDLDPDGTLEDEEHLPG